MAQTPPKIPSLLTPDAPKHLRGVGVGGLSPSLIPLAPMEEHSGEQPGQPDSIAPPPLCMMGPCDDQRNQYWSFDAVDLCLPEGKVYHQVLMRGFWVAAKHLTYMA